jgi:hypothetical protein
VCCWSVLERIENMCVMKLLALIGMVSLLGCNVGVGGVVGGAQEITALSPSARRRQQPWIQQLSPSGRQARSVQEDYP